MELWEKTLKKTYMYRGKIINVRKDEAQLADGQKAIREVVEHTGGVGIAALTADRNILLVRQWRYPIESVLTEIPAGKINPGEDPAACAARELAEETGAKAEKIIRLGEILVSPGFCTEKIHLYFATGLTFDKATPDEDEFVELFMMPISAAVEQVLDGRLADAKTVAAILMTHHLLLSGKL